MLQQHKKVGHEIPAEKQDFPFPHIPLDYGAKVEYAQGPDTTTAIDATNKENVQKVSRKF